MFIFRMSTVHRILYGRDGGGADRIGIPTGLQLLQRRAQCTAERLHTDTVFAYAAGR